jgi:hypothetical protein
VTKGERASTSLQQFLHGQAPNEVQGQDKAPKADNLLRAYSNLAPWEDSVILVIPSTIL